MLRHTLRTEVRFAFPVNDTKTGDRWRGSRRCGESLAPLQNDITVFLSTADLCQPRCRKSGVSGKFSRQVTHRFITPIGPWIAGPRDSGPAIGILYSQGGPKLPDWEWERESPFGDGIGTVGRQRLESFGAVEAKFMVQLWST